jgi:hypothetical protein
VTTPEIHTYMQTSQGRSRAFVIDDVKVLVSGHEDDDRAKAVAEHLASAHDMIEVLQLQVTALRRVVPPKAPAKILGPGVVRMRDRELWILNRADEGWASFGFRAGSWDDLFRRFDVVVTGHGHDETGEFWRVESCTSEPSSNTQEKT